MYPALTMQFCETARNLPNYLHCRHAGIRQTQCLVWIPEGGREGGRSRDRGERGREREGEGRRGREREGEGGRERGREREGGREGERARERERERERESALAWTVVKMSLLRRMVRSVSDSPFSMTKHGGIGLPKGSLKLPSSLSTNCTTVGMKPGKKLT